MNAFIIILFLGSVAEIFTIVFYTIYSKRYRLIFNTETSRIATIKKGFYEIKGKVTSLKEELISPMARISCVYYKFKVEEQRSSGKNSHWHTIIKDEKHVRFGIQDNSGIAYIEADGAKLVFNKDDKGNTGIFKPATDELEAAMKMYGKTSAGWLSDKTLKYEETYITEGDELYILGEVSELEGRYPVFKKEKLPFLISDKSEESLLKSSKRIVQITLFIMITIPVCLIAYLMHLYGLF